MLDSISVPRRSYDFEDYIDILRRNFVWLIAPAFLGLVIATVVAYSLEDVYVSAALIRVTPQQVSEKIFTPITSQDVADRINSMSQTIMSRNVLASVITSNGIYKKELSKEPMEDVVEKMRHNIGIRMTEGVAAANRVLPAMVVSFAHNDPRVAQRVCADLVSRFMSTSSASVLENRREVHDFVTDEMMQAKKDMEAAEQKVADFRAKNAGHLPEQMSMNMSQMQALEGRLGSLSELLNRNTEQKMILDNQLTLAKNRLSAVKSPEIVAHNDKVGDLNRQIERMELNIESMKGRYTDDYPDLISAKDNLAFLKKQRDAAMKEKVVVADTKYDPTTATAERMAAEDQIAQINTQLKALSMEAAQYRRDMGNVNNAIKVYQSRLEVVPAGEKEYGDLVREADVARQKFLSLQGTQTASTLDIRKEDRKLGQNLEVIDPASLPTAPAAPKRSSMLPIGVVAGLALGIVIVAIREVKDTSLKSLKDARLYTQLDILGSVPLLENDIVVARRKQMMWVGWATATIAGLLIIAGSVARYYLAKG
jgi:polysaccharide chain length determinant protein (PEP-CTERM system associated)